MDRKVLGTEKISLLNGEEKTVNVYAIGHYEKTQFIRKYTKDVYDKGHHYKTVDELAIVDEILKVALSEVNIEHLDYDAHDIYQKYFGPKEQEKKEKTSIIGQTDTA